MRIQSLFTIVILGRKAAATCVVDDCFQAFKYTATSQRNHDCESFLRLDSPSTRSTTLSTVVITATGSSDDEARTAKQASIPAYASVCSSSRAYISACSCLGISASSPAPRTTPSAHIDESQTSTTIDSVLSFKDSSSASSQLYNSTSSGFRNTTTPLFPNSTSHAASLRSTSSSNASLPLTSFESASFTNTWRFSSPTRAGASSSLRPQASMNPPSSVNTVSTTSLSNAVFSTSANNSQLFNATSTGLYPNSTTSMVSALNATATSQSSNGTATAPFMSTINATIASLTSSPHLNDTRPLAATTTTPPFHNSTSSAPHFTNTTRSANGTTPAPSAPAPTATIDRTCGETTIPFAVQIGQPGGMFDGWFLKLSGDAIIFAPPATDSATQFSVEGSGHLCVVGRLGTQGNAIIAIAENATDVTGSGVYFIDPEVLEDIDELGYAALQCDVSDDGLRCEEGAKEYWVGCGLGLDITSDGDGEAEIGGWDCTGITLAPVYS